MQLVHVAQGASNLGSGVSREARPGHPFGPVNCLSFLPKALKFWRLLLKSCTRQQFKDILARLQRPTHV